MGKKWSARVPARSEAAEAKVKQTTGAELSGGGATAQQWHIGQGRQIIPISLRVEPTSGLCELEVSVVDWCQELEQQTKKKEKNIDIFICDNWKI